MFRRQGVAVLGGALPGFFGSSPQQVTDIGVRLRAPLPLAHNLRREAKAAAFIFPIRPFRVRLPLAARLRNLIVHGLERGQLAPSTQRDAPTTMEIAALWSIGATKIKRVKLSPA